MPYIKESDLSGFSWETWETKIIKLLQRELMKIYSHTEMEIDDLGKEDLLAIIRTISKDLEHMNVIVYEEMVRLIERDSWNHIRPQYICNDHEGHKIYKCDECCEKMNKEMK